MVAFAATSLGQTLRVTGSAALPSVSIDNVPGTAGPDGVYQFTGLMRRPHEVAIGADKDRRSFVVGTEAASGAVDPASLRS